MTEHKTTVTVQESGAGLYTQDIKAARHSLTADEAVDLGGNDAGPAPYDLLLSSLGACTTMTLRMYANQKKWPLEKTAVTLTHQKETDAAGKKIDVIHRDIRLNGPLDDAQKARLLEIADKCPIHRTLENKPTIITALEN